MEDLLSDDAVRLVASTVISAVGFSGMHLAIRPVVRKYPKIAPKQYGDWVNRVVAVFHAIVSGTLGVIILLAEPPFAAIAAEVAQFRPVDTVHGTSDRLWHAVPFTLGYFIYDCIIMSVDPQVFMRLMVVHHLVSLCVWPLSLLSGAGTFYLAYFLFTEVSTPFLHFAIFFLPVHGIETGIRTIIGWGMLLTFFLARILPIPMLYYSLWQSRPYWEDVHPVIRGLAFCTLPIPPLMFVYWFARMVKGAIKHLLADAKEKEKKTQ